MPIITPGNAQPSNVDAGIIFNAGANWQAVGTIPYEGAVVLTPSGNNTVAIPAGHHNGAGYVAEVSVPAVKVQSDTTIAGVQGTMPEKGSPTLQPGASITPGHYSGGSVASSILSVQYGTITIAANTGSATATISSVNMAESVVIPLGFASVGGGYPCDAVNLTLTNSTTVTAARNGIGTATSVVVNFVVVQFNNLKSRQSGSINLIGVSSATTTITSVNPAKAICFLTGWTNSSNNGGSYEYGIDPLITLTNSTTVTGLLYYSNTGVTAYFTVCEFY
jgi:hypothetical protein